MLCDKAAKLRNLLLKNIGCFPNMFKEVTGIDSSSFSEEEEEEEEVQHEDLAQYVESLTGR